MIDIQIIFELQARPNNLGHFVCVHYRADERKVYLNDSLKRRRRRTKLCTHFFISKLNFELKFSQIYHIIHHATKHKFNLSIDCVINNI